MESIQEKDESAELECDQELDEKHAAYLLGRNIWLIEGWLQSVHSIAQHPERPWEWFPLQSMFGTSYDSAPTDHFAQINEALISLVNSSAVDAAVLVELHRALDAALEEVESVADFAVDNRRGDLCESYWTAASHLARAGELTTSLLIRKTESPENWRQFGDLLGKLLTLLANDYGAADFPGWITGVTDLARRLLPCTTTDQLEQLCNSLTDSEAGTATSQINNKLISLLQQLDALSDDVLRKERKPPGPYIVLSETGEAIVFLGTMIPFKKFHVKNAMGGIKLLRVFMKSPGEFLSAKDLLDKSGLGIDVNQLYTYLSRFRSVISSTENKWPSEFRRGENHHRAKNAFIETRRKRRTRTNIEIKSDPEGPSYKLDLPASRIAFVD